MHEVNTTNDNGYHLPFLKYSTSSATSNRTPTINRIIPAINKASFVLLSSFISDALLGSPGSYRSGCALPTEPTRGIHPSHPVPFRARFRSSRVVPVIPSDGALHAVRRWVTVCRVSHRETVSPCQSSPRYTTPSVTQCHVSVYRRHCGQNSDSDADANLSFILHLYCLDGATPRHLFRQAVRFTTPCASA